MQMISRLPRRTIGSLYGFNWRSWGAEYKGMDHDHRGEGIDQLQNARFN